MKGETVEKEEKYCLQQIVDILDKIIAKKALTPNDCQLTESESNECPEFATSKAKANSIGATTASIANTSLAIVKLCSFIGDKPTREAINIKLTSYTPAEVRAFFEDINNTTVCNNGGCLANNVQNLNADYVSARKIVYDARCAGCDIKREMDWGLLTSVRLLLGDATFLNDIKTTESTGQQALSIIIARNKRANCFVCSLPNADARHLRKITEYLDDVYNFVVNYGGLRNVPLLPVTTTPDPLIDKVGFSEVIGAKGIKNAGTPQVEGTAFILKFLNSNEFTTMIGSIGSISGFEVKYQQGSECSADITLINNRLIECKSWNLYNPNTWDNMPSNQFLTYIGATSSMNNLQYWFEGIKITGTTDAQKLTNLKTKFQEVFRKNNPAGNNIVFEKIWSNTNGLRESLFGNIQPQDLVIQKPIKQALFATWVSDTNNSLYNFIKVK